MNIHSSILAALALVCVPCSAALSNEQDISTTTESVTVHLADNGKAQTNPGMGWNLMYYTFDGVCTVPANERTDLLDYVPCDIISFRVSWAAMEPKEGEYNDTDRCLSPTLGVDVGPQGPLRGPTGRFLTLNSPSPRSLAKGLRALKERRMCPL